MVFVTARHLGISLQCCCSVDQRLSEMKMTNMSGKRGFCVSALNSVVYFLPVTSGSHLTSGVLAGVGMRRCLPPPGLGRS